MFLRAVLNASALVVWLSTCAIGATLTGAVRDPSQAPVPKASIEATNLATGLKVPATADALGSYTLSLAPGKYEIRVVAAGFDPAVSEIEIGATDTTRNLQLTVAQHRESIEVSGGANKLANSDPVYRALRESAPSESVAVENLVLKRDAGEFKFRRGIFSLCPPVLGKQVFAIFSGEGEFSLTPVLGIEKAYLRSVTKSDTISERYEKLVIAATDRTIAEVKAQGKAVALDPRAKNVLDELRSRVRHRREHPRSMLEAMLADDDMENLDAELLGDLYNPSRTGSFRAYLFGKRFSDLRYVVNPRGAFPFLPSPEEVGLVSLDPLGNDDAILYLSHWASELNENKASSEEDKRVATAEHYSIETVIGGNTHLTAIARIRLRAVAGGDRVIRFGLLPNLRVSRVTAAARDIPYIQQDRKEDGSFYLILPEALVPSGKVEIEVEYQGDKVIRRAGGGNFSVGARTNWYPSLNSFIDHATYDLTFKVPKKYTLVGVGNPVKEWREQDYAASHWVSEIPLAVAGFNYGEFKKKEVVDEVARYRIEGYAGTELPDYLAGAESIGGMVPSRLIEKTIAETQNSMRIFQDWFGPAPYGRIAITQQPQFNFGQSWPGLVYLPLSAYLDATQRWQLLGGISRGMNEFIQEVTPHEVSHQWWGHMVSWSSFHDQWLSEGFADFSAGLYLQFTERKPDKYLKYWDRARETILEKNNFGRRANDAGPLWLGLRLATAKNEDAYQRIVYSKGGYVLHMLRMMMWDPKTGDDAFKNMMRDFVKTHLHKTASTESFLATVNRHMTPKMDLAGNRSMDWFIREWVLGTEVPRYKLDYEVTAQGDKYLLKATLAQSEVSPAFMMPVPLYVELEDGRFARLGSVRMAGNATSNPIQVTLPVKPARVLVNAQHDILEMK